MQAPTQKMKEFARLCFELKDQNEAYRRVYDVSKSTDSSISTLAARLRADVRVASIIKTMEDAAAATSIVTVQMVLEQWWKIATADPNDIISARKICCRNCHGIDHAFQWIDENEWALAVARALDTGKSPPDMAGGFGFRLNNAPHAECPQCTGEGITDVFIHDTRYLKGNARHLYAGVKKTRSGVEIVMRDQDAALANIARHLGMFNDRMPGDANGNPVVIEHVKRTIVDPRNSDAPKVPAASR
jgi:phage terminase small subunit